MGQVLLHCPVLYCTVLYCTLLHCTPAPLLGYWRVCNTPRATLPNAEPVQVQYMLPLSETCGVGDHEAVLRRGGLNARPGARVCASVCRGALLARAAQTQAKPSTVLYYTVDQCGCTVLACILYCTVLYLPQG